MNQRNDALRQTLLGRAQASPGPGPGGPSLGMGGVPATQPDPQDTMTGSPTGVPGSLANDNMGRPDLGQTIGGALSPGIAYGGMPGRGGIGGSLEKPLGSYGAPELPMMAPNGLPTQPPAQASRVPPAMQRYLTGMQMQQAYANNWSPNPMLLRVLNGK
jgi:hypothetical protein